MKAGFPPPPYSTKKELASGSAASSYRDAARALHAVLAACPSARRPLETSPSSGRPLALQQEHSTNEHAGGMQILNILPVKIRDQRETWVFRDRGSAAPSSARDRGCTQTEGRRSGRRAGRQLRGLAPGGEGTPGRCTVPLRGTPFLFERYFLEQILSTKAFACGAGKSTKLCSQGEQVLGLGR